ncbi:hypothetical protein BDW66DRAFT_42998 [Aspergillus desertorum]
MKFTSIRGHKAAKPILEQNAYRRLGASERAQLTAKPMRPLPNHAVTRPVEGDESPGYALAGIRLAMAAELAQFGTLSTADGWLRPEQGTAPTNPLFRLVGDLPSRFCQMREAEVLYRRTVSSPHEGCDNQLLSLLDFILPGSSWQEARMLSVSSSPAVLPLSHPFFFLISATQRSSYDRLLHPLCADRIPSICILTSLDRG